jgi:hypothetical protein
MWTRSYSLDHVGDDKEMIFRFRWKLLGGHVHVRVVVNGTIAGNIILREDEWTTFRDKIELDDNMHYGTHEFVEGW